MKLRNMKYGKSKYYFVFIYQINFFFYFSYLAELKSEKENYSIILIIYRLECILIFDRVFTVFKKYNDNFFFFIVTTVYLAIIVKDAAREI